MSSPNYRFVVLSVVKHSYVPSAMAAHPRFEPVVVADDPDMPDWVHERNEEFARGFDIPYVRDVDRAIADFDVQVAVVSSQAERHCDLSVRAANAGLHVVQDKPMSHLVSECDRVVEAVERNKVKFLLWNRNYLPALVQARDCSIECICVSRVSESSRSWSRAASSWERAPRSSRSCSPIDRLLSAISDSKPLMSRSRSWRTVTESSALCSSASLPSIFAWRVSSCCSPAAKSTLASRALSYSS